MTLHCNCALSHPWFNVKERISEHEKILDASFQVSEINIAELISVLAMSECKGTPLPNDDLKTGAYPHKNDLIEKLGD